MPSIHLADCPDPFHAELGAIVWPALAQAGVPVLAMCASGECGRCDSRIVALDELPMSMPMPTPTSIAGDVQQRDVHPADLIDAGRPVERACCRRVDRDLAVRFVDAAAACAPWPHVVHARLIDVSPLARDVFSFAFAMESTTQFRFLAGQYARLEFALPDGGVLQREYSIASPPSLAERDGLLVFHVRAAPNGHMARLIESSGLVLGMQVRIEGPFGRAHLRPRERRSLLLLAGGTGLAPMLSIAETAIEQRSAESIRIYVGVRSERDVYGEAALIALSERHPNLRYVVVLSEPGGETARRTGLISDAIAQDFDDVSEQSIHLAGPPAMVDAVTRVLIERGAQAYDIMADVYQAPSGHTTSKPLVV